MPIYLGNTLQSGLADVTTKANKEDNLTITNNSSNNIQAVGVIDDNTGNTRLKVWKGTQAQYDALATKDSNTLYLTPDSLNTNDYVTINTAQTVMGAKTFNGAITSSGTNTFSGSNTFSGTTLVPTTTNTGTTDTNAVNVKYLYDQGYMTGTKAFPSSRYIDLTLGASGSTYTAPSNGYFFVGARSIGGVNCYINTIGTSTPVNFYEVRGYDAYTMMTILLPVRKNDIASFCYYNLVTPVDGFFKFIYSDGSPSA